MLPGGCAFSWLCRAGGRVPRGSLSCDGFEPSRCRTTGFAASRVQWAGRAAGPENGAPGSSGDRHDRVCTVQSAVQAMKLGAYDYITKPFNFEELRLELERVTAHLKLTAENRVLREQLKSKQGFGQLVGHSPEMEKLYRIISKAAHEHAPGTHPGRERHGKGTGRPLHTLLRCLQGQAIYSRGLRIAGANAHRK